MSRTHLLAAVSFFGLVASTAAFADSNTVNLNQAGSYNIADAYQDYNTVGNSLTVTQDNNQFSRTSQAGAYNSISSNQTGGGYNFLGAPNSYTAQPYNYTIARSTVNSALGGRVVVQDSPFSQSGDHNSLSNTQSGYAGLVQGSQTGSYNSVTSNQSSIANALTVYQNGTGNSISSYQSGFEIAAVSQVGNGNVSSGVQSGGQPSLAGLNSVTVDQNGNGNQAYYNQNNGGYNVMTVAQTGTGNVSSLTQSGSHNLATVTQH